MEHKLAPHEVKAGMYVRRFGGSWFDHPFWFPRFVVRPEDVPRFAASDVPYVVIDDQLGFGPNAPSEPPRKADPASFARRKTDKEGGRHPRQPERYDARWKDNERAQAKKLAARSLKVMRRNFGEVRLGRAIRITEVGDLVDDVVASVERSPRTLLEVLRLKKKDEYTYLHSVAVCTLMITVARHLGLPEREVRDYGMAGLLHDIGKMGIADEVLNKAGRLTDGELEQVRGHPEHGFQVLSQTSNIPELALDVCRHHHERPDGQGYPFGLPAGDISIAARLGAICDVYDALTSERVYKDAWTPAEAVTAMWDWEGQFDRKLQFAFMQSIGVFPPGMLVELRSNRLALVLASRRKNAPPRVLAFYSMRDRQPIVPEDVTISDSFAKDSITAPSSPEYWGLTERECSEDFIRGKLAA
ncbi:HD-GYP domain-containing protein [Qipengyuania sp. MTN3-11]|uniref:HD-GYP domain-containing protein n=1 Tax=Qipengyuania sp. MTN3-11 TaxID=3056557 RepID=UPI0036F44AC4